MFTSSYQHMANAQFAGTDFVKDLTFQGGRQSLQGPLDLDPIMMYQSLTFAGRGCGRAATPPEQGNGPRTETIADPSKCPILIRSNAGSIPLVRTYDPAVGSSANQRVVRWGTLSAKDRIWVKANYPY